MSKAIDSIPDFNLTTVTRTELEFLADRLCSLAVSHVTAIGPREREDALIASRVIRRLLSVYEYAAGRQLHALFLDAPPRPRGN